MEIDGGFISASYLSRCLHLRLMVNHEMGIMMLRRSLLMLMMVHEMRGTIHATGTILVDTQRI